MREATTGAALGTCQLLKKLDQNFCRMVFAQDTSFWAASLWTPRDVRKKTRKNKLACFFGFLFGLPQGAIAPVAQNDGESVAIKPYGFRSRYAQAPYFICVKSFGQAFLKACGVWGRAPSALLTKIFQRTLMAPWIARHTVFAPEQDDAMTKIALLRGLDEVREYFFHLCGVF